MTTATGKILPDNLIAEKATEIIQFMAMWGLSRTDAYRVARDMKYTLQNMNDKEYVNPLAGTGLKAALDPNDKPIADFDFGDENNLKKVGEGH